MTVAGIIDHVFRPDGMVRGLPFSQSFVFFKNFSSTEFCLS